MLPTCLNFAELLLHQVKGGFKVIEGRGDLGFIGVGAEAVLLPGDLGAVVGGQVWVSGRHLLALGHLGLECLHHHCTQDRNRSPKYDEFASDESRGLLGMW